MLSAANTSGIALGARRTDLGVQLSQPLVRSCLRRHHLLDLVLHPLRLQVR